MNKRLGTLVPILLAALGRPALLAGEDHPAKHRRYALVDIGTFGGPISNVTFGAVVVNESGTLVGGADTTIPAQPCNPFWSPSCLVSQALEWHDGTLTNLGTLPGGINSFAISINSPGQVVGVSEDGLIDPVFGAEFVATLWKKNGQVVNLGTLGGSFSLPNSVNDRGQAAGGAENLVPDPDNLGGALIGLPSPTQWHAALWQHGTIQDLGTLGDGPASFALFVNERGQVAGMSYTNSIPNPETGIPTIDPFFWDKGHLVDIGTLGGVLGGVGALNNRGQVTGSSNVTRDGSIDHAFLWERGSLVDLGTLGGDFSFGNWIDDSGEVVGGATTEGNQELRAVRWKNGKKTNLGSLNGDQCSFATSSNFKGQIVGSSGDCDQTVRPFLWENGGPMVDLNSLIPPGSGLLLHEAAYINERGEIAGLALLPNGDEHAFLLIPSEDDADDEVDSAASMDSGRPATVSASIAARRILTPAVLGALRGRMARSRGVGLRPPKRAQ